MVSSEVEPDRMFAVQPNGARSLQPRGGAVQLQAVQPRYPIGDRNAGRRGLAKITGFTFQHEVGEVDSRTERLEA